ncbi:hypothetical protein OESDEN_21165 [Oesophagostomum dentatum]|uniref:Endonuclease/exonuclease/phosphatase domain-containing protein n=1 Tax=Oesophagostomum dentatum TaxID=61180 RepID=A0A0B1S7M6_OESDE|nr:hypothetical protein OESDEN_21165 [Oesophagostomum dentatum]
MFQKKAARRWTWSSPNGQTKSEIDHILTNRKWSLFDVSVVPSFITNSDHRLLRAVVNLDKKLEKKILHRPAKSIQQKYDYSLLPQLIRNKNWIQSDDLNEDYENFITVLKDCERSCAVPVIREERLSEETKQLLKMRVHIKNNPNSSEIQRRAVDIACRNNLRMDLRNYRQRKLLAAAETRKSIKRCRRNLIQEKRVFTALKDEAGQTSNSKKDMEKIVEKFYKELYSSKSSEVSTSIADLTEAIPSVLPSEVRTAIDLAKSGTAPGSDGITVELLKSGGPELHKILAEKFSTRRSTLCKESRRSRKNAEQSQ